MKGKKGFQIGHKINLGKPSHMLGKKHKEKSKIKTSLAVKKSHEKKEYGFIKGHKTWNKGKPISLETKRKMMDSMRKTFSNPELIKLLKQKRALQIMPIIDTSIEVKIQNYLKELGINFFTHQYMKEIEHSYQCDILIPSMNLVIETDGNYWHKYPVGLDIDKIRTKELIEKGFRVLRLWESDIKVMDLEKFEGVLYE